MPTRLLIAYLLIVLLVAGGGVLAWRAYHYSDRKVRHRARRARRAARQQSGTECGGGGEPEPGD